MAEGDDDKESDSSKPPPKFLKRIPKLIIRRTRPNADKKLPPPPPASSVPPAKRAKETHTSSTATISKYAELAELVSALEEERPQSLQEVWHCSHFRQLEDECYGQANGEDPLHWFYASGKCDFGADCEMPWLHASIDEFTVKNSAGGGALDEQEQVISRSPTAKEILEDRQEPDESDQGGKNGNIDIQFADWRYGAAKLFYDSMDISNNCKTFTYGFKLRDEESDCQPTQNVFADDAYLMVSQLRWEDDVIWDAAAIKEEVRKKTKTKWLSLGGKESNYDRNFGASRYSYQHRLPGYLHMTANERNFYNNRSLLFKSPYSMQVLTTKERDDSSKSVLPFDNEDLTCGIWENEVIWDPENMSHIPKPKIPTLDPSDENLVLGVPDDGDFQLDWATSKPHYVKLSHPHDKNCKIVIGKAGIRKINEKDQRPVFLEDPFNVSNDSYYTTTSSEISLRLKPVAKLIQHSIPVLELRPPFIPTHLSVLRLQNFHRPPLKRYSYGPLSHVNLHPVFSLSREISWRAELREEERQAAGGGDIFFMREREDLSGRDGDLVLVEFSEEHPLIMNEIGMCSKMINYYKRKASKDQGPPKFRFGEVVYPHTSPFLGVLSQGQCVQTVENNMYRCPIFEHQVKESDFLVIRTRHILAIREVDALFVAGQQFPLYEVPAPNSKCARNFSRDFLQVHIFRMFQNCSDIPQWVKMDEIKRAFPEVSDINIRKILKLCSDFKKVDSVDSNCWVLRSDFCLPSEEELRAMVTPEQCCAQFSMMAAKQRLKDEGYGSNCLFVPPEDGDEDDGQEVHLKIDDEVKAAPWNLTRGFIEAVNGVYLLDLTGYADPTGCGEGFSYLTRSKRPGKQSIVQDSPVVMEKASPASAKVFLKKMGIPDAEIKKLSGWELVDIARSFSKKKIRGRGKISKVPKVRPMTTAEHLVKYKEECQRIFDLQNKVLKSSEELSTDEEDVSDDDNVEEMGKILEKLISNGRSYSEVCCENEEKEREELVKMMMGESLQKQSEQEKVKENKKKREQSGTQPARVLKICRTFRDATGKEYTRVEFVRKTSVIDFYLKIRATQDEALIRNYALESADKQKILREKRSILNQLKQIDSLLEAKQDSGKGSQSHSEDHFRKPDPVNYGSNVSGHRPFLIPASKKLNSKVDLKRRCSACGNPGHKKGNRACPEYCGPVKVAMTEEEEEEYQRQMNVDDQNLVNVDGTKLKLSVKLIKRAEEMKRKTLLLRVPKDMVKKRKRPLVEARCDYLEKYQRPVNRRRVDPVVVLSNAFESILMEMRDLPESDPFHYPVNAKVAPHYHARISRPMDLQTIRENLRQRKYQSRNDFLVDVHQIVQNSSTFNGPESPFTIQASKMLDLCVRRMGEQEEELIRLEETINPPDDEKDQAFMPQKTAVSPANGIGVTPSLPKSLLDLTISDTEDEAEIKTEYLEGRACPVVP